MELQSKSAMFTMMYAQSLIQMHDNRWQTLFRLTKSDIFIAQNEYKCISRTNGKDLLGHRSFHLFNRNLFIMIRTKMAMSISYCALPLNFHYNFFHNLFMFHITIHHLWKNWNSCTLLQNWDHSLSTPNMGRAKKAFAEHNVFYLA